MARLQRKKTSSAKKKKKQSAAGATSPRLKNDVAAKKTTLFTGSAGEIGKRSSLSQTKALTRTKTEPGKIKNYINKGVQFLREVKVELKKVVWPTRKQTLSSTVRATGLQNAFIIKMVIWSLYVECVSCKIDNIC